MKNLDKKIEDFFTPEIKEFVQLGKISLEEIRKKILEILSVLPRCKFNFDLKSYGNFGVLRLEPLSEKTLQPLLFGARENLATLGKQLWEDSFSTWAEVLEDSSHRGTFLKKEVLNKTILSLLEKYFGKKKGSKILDLGCGEGVLIREILNLYQNVFGLDFTEGFVKKLKTDFPEKTENFFSQNILKFQPGQKFDCLFANMFLLDLVQIEKALDKVVELLEEGGLFLVSEINSKFYKALGFYEGLDFTQVYSGKEIFFTEKFISGHTKAVHCFHPFDFYKAYLEKKGLVCLEDFIIGPSKEQVLKSDFLTKEQKEKLLLELQKEFKFPPFHFLVFKK